MTYKEFKQTYSYLSKEYPDASCFLADDKWNEDIITLKKTKYEKRGSRWHMVDEETESVCGRYYCNAVDAVPWFRNLGGKEVVSTRYTKYGKIPYLIHSISPDRKEKYVFEYNF